jgi:hypothetical protein
MPTHPRIVEEDLRFKFYDGETFFLAYNKGSTQYGDMYKSRPDFYPVYSPSGREVTCTCAYRFNHHKSIFIGHANVNGINFFHDNNPTRTNLGDIVLERSESEVDASGIHIITHNGWITKAGERMVDEERNFTVSPGETAHIIDITSTLIASETDLTFEKDTHSFLGVRVADTMDVEDGGTILNSNGQRNEDEAMRQYADWTDYSGVVVGQKVGVTIMNHPSNPPCPFFTRNYGTFLTNFTLMEKYELPRGERLTQRFRVLIHEGDAVETNIGEYYRQFVETEPRW